MPGGLVRIADGTRESVGSPCACGVDVQCPREQHRGMTDLRGRLADGHLEVLLHPEDRNAVRRWGRIVVGQVGATDLQAGDARVQFPHRAGHEHPGLGTGMVDGDSVDVLRGTPVRSAGAAGDLPYPRVVPCEEGFLPRAGFAVRAGTDPRVETQCHGSHRGGFEHRAAGGWIDLGDVQHDRHRLHLRRILRIGPVPVTAGEYAVALGETRIRRRVEDRLGVRARRSGGRLGVHRLGVRLRHCRRSGRGAGFRRRGRPPRSPRG